MRLSRKNAPTEITTAITTNPQNAMGECSSPLGTFIPYRLAIRVGSMRRMETLVIRFMIVFTLLEITLAKASIVPVRISAWMVTVL